MSNLRKPVFSLLLFVAAALFLLTPVVTEAAGRAINTDLSGVITIQREDGTIYTIDYEGTLRAGLHREQIVIDFIGTGVMRETNESVAFTSTRAGVFQRVGNRILFNVDGEFTLERENGNRIAICPTGYGIIQQNGRNIAIDITDVGVVEATGENVTIYTVGAGEL